MSSLSPAREDPDAGAAAELWTPEAPAPVVATRFYGIASECVRIDFACAELLSALDPALEHLRVGEPRRPPGLEVLVASGPGQAPAASLIRDETFLEVPSSDSPRLRARYEAQAGCFYALDHDRRRAHFWQADATRLPPHHRAAPLRALFNWWLAGRGLQCVHAAACGTPLGAVLVAGPGGSGKSTLSAACVLQGMQFVADDYLAVSIGQRPTAHSLTGTLKLSPEHAARCFPSLPLPPDVAPGDKAVLYLGERFPGSLARSLPLRALLASRVLPGAASRVEPLAKTDALRALMPSTLALFPGGYRQAVARLSQLVRELPAYRIVIGDDLEAVPGLLRGLIEGGAA
jgi:hypothetical protein